MFSECPEVSFAAFGYSGRKHDLLSKFIPLHYPWGEDDYLSDEERGKVIRPLRVMVPLEDILKTCNNLSLQGGKYTNRHTDRQKDRQTNKHTDKTRFL